MTIKEFLQNYSGKQIFYQANPGNGGDALIAFGAYSLFKELGVNYTIVKDNTDLTDKIVFYGGGGNLVKEYPTAANFISKNISKIKELVILPHTINDHKELIGAFGSNVTVLCREHLTYNYIQETAPNCKCHLIEDLAFSLPISTLKSKFRKNIIPVFWRKHIWKMFRYQGSVIHPVLNILFGRELYAFRIDHEKTNIKRPANSLDLSELILYDGKMTDPEKVEKNVVDILSVINKYKKVHTNRLHICIGAALLGKQVNFYPNSYYKNESIYLMSLKDKFSNVKWCGERTIN